MKWQKRKLPTKPKGQKASSAISTVTETDSREGIWSNPVLTLQLSSKPNCYFFLKKIEKEKKDISFLRSLSTHLPISLGPNAHFVVSEPSAHQVTSLKRASKDKSLIQEINSHKKYSNVNVRVFTSVVMRSSCCVRRTWMSIPLRNKEINEGWFMWIDWNQIKL